ncbi:hypothetical protein JCM10212_000917 [Sporobolomyces blumeae]
MAPRNLGPAPINDNPFANLDFNAGLEAAGYLQKLDVSEERITARFQHGLEKAAFAAHSEEFCGQQGVRKVHRSVVQFFHEDPTPMDPFVHVIVGTLPPPEQAIVTPRGGKQSTWTPIGSDQEAPGTAHFTVSIKGFWPITVVFDSNQANAAREDRYRRINPDDDSESDPEAYLDNGASYSRRSRSGRASGYGGVRRSSSRASRSRRAAAYDDDDDDTASGEEDDYVPPRRRRGSISARSQRSRRDSVVGDMAEMSLGRSSSRASRRRTSMAY